MHFYEGADTEGLVSLSTCDRVGGLPKWLGGRLLIVYTPEFISAWPWAKGFPQGSLAPEGLRFQFQHALSVAVVSVKDLDLFGSEDQ